MSAIVDLYKNQLVDQAIEITHLNHCILNQENVVLFQQAEIERKENVILALSEEIEKLTAENGRHRNTYVTKAWESLEAERDADEALLRSCYEILGSGYGDISEKLEERLGL